VRPLLNIHCQTELAINTQVTVVNIHTLVSDVHQNVANTHTIVSDIRRDMLKREEGTDHKNRMVSGIRTICVAELTLTTT